MGNRWAMLAVVFFTRISMGFQFQSIASVTPALIADLGLTYAQAGFLMGLYLLPGALITLPGGVIGQRFGARRVALWGLALMIAGGLVTAGSGGFALACAGRAVSGIGAILMNLLLAKMIAHWFRGKEMATAMGVMLGAWPFGLTVAVLGLGSAAAVPSWRAAVSLTVAAAAIAFGLLASLYHDPPQTHKPAQGGGPLRLDLPLRAWALAGAGGAVWSLLNAGFLVLVAFAPVHLVAGGISAGRAGFLVSLGLWVSIASVPLGGYLADRIGRPDLVIVVGCLATALPMALLPLLPGPGVWLILFGVLLGAAPGAIMALLPHALRPDHLAAGLGFFYTVYYLGTAAGPWPASPGTSAAAPPCRSTSPRC